VLVVDRSASAAAAVEGPADSIPEEVLAGSRLVEDIRRRHRIAGGTEVVVVDCSILGSTWLLRSSVRQRDKGRLRNECDDD